MSISSTLAKTVSAVASFGLNMTRALFGLSTASNSSTRIRSTATQPVDSESLASATQVLGLIYRLMLRAKDQKEKLRIEGERIETNLEKKYNDRNDEIVKAIRGIKPKAPKVEVKPPPPPTEAVTPTVPTPPVTPKIPTPPVTALPKITPKAPATKIITGTAAAGLGLLPLLAKGESKDPNQLVYPKKEFKGIAPTTAPLTTMTIKEVIEKQTEMQVSGRYPSTAVGKYQMIKTTLQGAVEKLGLDLNSKFDESMQDRIYQEYLISKKRPAVEAFISGKSDNLELAQIELAKEFASFPVPKDMTIKNKDGKTIRTLKKGQSYYAGDGVNKAHISVEESARGLLEERQARLGVPTQQNVVVTDDLNVGSRINASSVENKELVEGLKEKQSQSVSGTTIINQSDDSSMGITRTPEEVDDRPAILRKR